MTQRTGVACLVLVGAVTLLTSCVAGFELFCGKSNCYELLGLQRENCTQRDVKRAYRNLALEWHPDQNKHPDAPQKFAAIATANSILSNKEKREEYDDFLDHPEKYYWYFVEHMGQQFAPKTSVWVVISGLVSICTILHWLNARHNYNNLVRRVRASPEYRAKLEQAIKTGAASTVDEAETVVRVAGLEPPRWYDALPIQLAKLPWKILKQVYWMVHWVIAYWILKRDYTRADKEYLVKTRLRIMSDSQWELIDAETRTELVEARVWEDAAWQKYLQQKRFEQNRKGGARRNNALKQYTKTQRKQAPPPDMDDY